MDRYELFLNPLVDPVASRATIELRRTGSPDGSSNRFRARPSRFCASQLRESFEQPVLVGTSDAIRPRPGLVQGTAKPGRSATARSLDTGDRHSPLGTHPGDKIIGDPGRHVHVLVTNEPSQTVVMNTDVWVLDPVPGQPDVSPDGGADNDHDLLDIPTPAG